MVIIACFFLYIASLFGGGPVDAAPVADLGNDIVCRGEFCDELGLARW